jgi:hypothetical protein
VEVIEIGTLDIVIMLVNPLEEPFLRQEGQRALVDVYLHLISELFADAEQADVVDNRVGQ